MGSSVDDGGPQPAAIYVLPDPIGRKQMAAMALSEDYINFAVWWGGVYRIPKFGGEATPIEEGGNSFFRYIGARAGTVVWTRAAFGPQGMSIPPVLKKETIGQDPVALLELPYDVPAPVPFMPELQVTAANVFFSNGAATINQIALADGAASSIALPVAPGITPSWLADDSFVYFLPRSSSSASSGCVLRRIALAGGPPEDLAPCPAEAVQPWLVAIDGTDVYLAGTAGFWRVAKEGGAPAAIYQRAGTDVISIGLATVDDQNIYFLRISAGRSILASTSKAGGGAAPATVWDGVRGGLGDVMQVAQDGPILFTLHPWGIQVFPKTPN